MLSRRSSFDVIDIDVDVLSIILLGFPQCFLDLISQGKQGFEYLPSKKSIFVKGTNFIQLVYNKSYWLSLAEGGCNDHSSF